MNQFESNDKSLFKVTNFVIEHSKEYFLKNK